MSDRSCPKLCKGGRESWDPSEGRTASCVQLSNPHARATAHGRTHSRVRLVVDLVVEELDHERVAQAFAQPAHRVRRSQLVACDGCIVDRRLDRDERHLPEDGWGISGWVVGRMGGNMAITSQGAIGLTEQRDAVPCTVCQRAKS